MLRRLVRLRPLTTMDAPSATSHDDLVKRLRRAEGQIRGVQRMLDEGAECRSILTQLAAVKAAVDQVGLLLITDELRTCIGSGGERCEADFDQAVATFLRHATLSH